jgi:hypothetical protein
MTSNSLFGTNSNPSQLGGLILDNSFTTLGGVIDQFVPVPISMENINLLILDNRFNTAGSIPQIDGIPVLFMPSTKDSVVFKEHMKSLFALCRSNDKNIREFPESGHSSSKDLDEYWTHIRAFLSKCIYRIPEPTAALMPDTSDPRLAGSVMALSLPSLHFASTSLAVSVSNIIDETYSASTESDDEDADLDMWRDLVANEEGYLEELRLSESNLGISEGDVESWDGLVARRPPDSEEGKQKLARLLSDVDEVRLSIKEAGIARASSALEHVADARLRGNVKTREVSLGNWSRELAEKTWVDNVIAKYYEAGIGDIDVKVRIITGKATGLWGTAEFLNRLEQMMGPGHVDDVIILPYSPRRSLANPKASEMFLHIQHSVWKRFGNGLLLETFGEGAGCRKA